MNLQALGAESVGRLVDTSRRKPLPTPALAAIAASLAGGFIFGIAEWRGRA